MVRQYAQAVGIVLILLGVAGVLLGDRVLADALNIDLAEDLVHIITGALLAYVGFAQRDHALIRNTVGGVGVLYLLVGVLGFVTPTLFGLLPNGYTIIDNLIHLVLGAASIAVAWLMPRDTRARI